MDPICRLTSKFWFVITALGWDVGLKLNSDEELVDVAAYINYNVFIINNKQKYNCEQ